MKKWRRQETRFLNMISLLILLLLLFQPHQVTSMKAELYTTHSFQLVKRTTYPHFVMFFASWCEPCKILEPIWDEFAVESQQRGRVKVAKVDCTLATPLCAAEKIRAYPTFFLYNNKEKHTFRGNRDLPDFTEFVQSVFPELQDGLVPLESMETLAASQGEGENGIPVYPTVVTKETFALEIEEDFTFVDFFAPWCGHCVELEPTWNILADAFKKKNKVTIAKVDCTAEPELCREQRIDSYPTLNLYKHGELVTSYYNERTLYKLVEFVQQHLDMEEGTFPVDEPPGPDAPPDDAPPDDDEEEPDEPPEEPDEPDEPSPTPTAHVKKTKVTNKLDDDTYFITMSTKPHLIYFHASGPHFARMEVLIFQQVQERLDNTPFDISVAVVDCSRTSLLCTDLRIDSFPSLQLFKTVSDVTLYTGMTDVDKIIEFVLGEMMSEGRTKSEL